MVIIFLKNISHFFSCCWFLSVHFPFLNAVFFIWRGFYWFNFGLLGTLWLMRGRIPEGGGATTTLLNSPLHKHMSQKNEQSIISEFLSAVIHVGKKIWSTFFGVQKSYELFPFSDLEHFSHNWNFFFPGLQLVYLNH